MHHASKANKPTSCNVSDAHITACIYKCAYMCTHGDMDAHHLCMYASTLSP